MKLCLSGRLIEGPNGPLLSLREFLDLAGRHAYDAVDVRASQLNPETTDAEIEALRRGLRETGVRVFEGGYGQALTNPTEETFVTFVRLLSTLGAVGIRMGGDFATLKRAARLASPYGIKVLYQMHTGGPFETVSTAAESIAAIGGNRILGSCLNQPTC